MGSDGATFNPYIQKEETLYFFNDALCRAMPLVFDKKVTASTLPGYRFVPRSDVFMSPKSVPENDCYCVDETLCGMIGDGMFGVSKCQMEAPIVLSWPHFLRGEQRFQDAVIGLRPDEERHGFWFDIQQTTGTTLDRLNAIELERMRSLFYSLSGSCYNTIPASTGANSAGSWLHIGFIEQIVVGFLE